MASYSLRGSYSTVQVLSPTLVNDVVYCTISTNPSGVIASIPVQKSVFDSNQASVELGNFADAIETIMDDPHVIAGVGEQSIDQSGLLEDTVVFTVQYTSATTPASGVTAEASVSAGMLNFTDGLIGETLANEVRAIIASVYDNLKSAASG